MQLVTIPTIRDLGATMARSRCTWSPRTRRWRTLVTLIESTKVERASDHDGLGTAPW